MKQKISVVWCLLILHNDLIYGSYIQGKFIYKYDVWITLCIERTYVQSPELDLDIFQATRKQSDNPMLLRHFIYK